MPFHFKKKESVARAVRRLCAERLDDALETLEKGAKLQAVHHVRKEIKKLRSLLRLIRWDIGRHTYSRHTAALRQAANLLAAFRDAQVKLNAFDTLVKYFRRNLPPQPFPEIKIALQENCLAREKQLARSIPPLKAILSGSKKRLDDLKLDARGWKAIAPGLEKIYRRNRKSFETARRQPSPKNFHEWRKRVKDLWHQLRLLCPAPPRALRRRTQQLEKLGNLLGDDHDLFMLQRFVARQFPQAQPAEMLEDLIVSRQKQLRSLALKLGGRCCRQRVSRFCRQVENCWKSRRK